MNFFIVKQLPVLPPEAFKEVKRFGEYRTRTSSSVPTPGRPAAILATQQDSSQRVHGHRRDIRNRLSPTTEPASAKFGTDAVAVRPMRLSQAPMLTVPQDTVLTATVINRHHVVFAISVTLTCWNGVLKKAG